MSLHKTEESRRLLSSVGSSSELELLLISQATGRRLPGAPVSKKKENCKAGHERATKWLLRFFDPVETARTLCELRVDLPWYIGLLAGMANDTNARPADRLVAADRLRSLTALGAASHSEIEAHLKNGKLLPRRPEHNLPDPLLKIVASKEEA